MLAEIDRCVRRGDDFAFETTLSGRGYVRRMEHAHAVGYDIHMFYLWIRAVDLALLRIQGRVQDGGHDVPQADVRRRYKRTLQNLFHLYRPHLDTLHFFDNSAAEPNLVFRDKLGTLTVLDHSCYRKILDIVGDMP